MSSTEKVDTNKDSQDASKNEDKPPDAKENDADKKPDDKKDDASKESDEKKDNADEKPAEKKDDADKNPDDKTEAKTEDSSDNNDANKKEDDKKESPKEDEKNTDKPDGDKEKESANAKADSKESDENNQPPTITISVTTKGSASNARGSGAELVKSAMLKARRLSIRAKSKTSTTTPISKSMIGRHSSGRVTAADNIANIEADNIWELAVKLKQLTTETADPDEGQMETTLIVLGGKQAGKTTLIGKLLDSEDTARKTLGLDYTYARHAGKGIGKDVCQIWELGGGTTFLNLLDTPVSANRLSDTACVIVVDLTHPDTIFPTVEECCKYMKELIDTKLDKAGATGVLVKNLLDSQLKARLPDDHPDKELIKPLLVPLALVGGMYDKFQPMDTADKKVVVEAMRWAAHTHFAHLMFFASSEVALEKRAKDMLSHLAFKTESNDRQALDVNKPLQVAAGADSYKAISGEGGATYEAVLKRVSDKWPYTKEKTGVPDDPSKDELFAEPEVDSLREEKIKELDRIRQDLERRRKMEKERDAAAKLKSKAPTQVGKEEAAAAAAEFLEKHHSLTAPAKSAKAPAKKTDKPAAKTGEKGASKKTDEKKEAPKKEEAKKDSKTAEKKGAKPAAKAEEKTASKKEDKPAAKKAEKSPPKKEAAKK